MTEQTALPAKIRSEPAVPAVFTRLRDEIDRLFEDFSFTRSSRSIFAFPAIAELSPAMELVENKDHYSLSVELPGMEEKDIELNLQDNVLTISGEKRQERKEGDGGRSYTERSYGRFQRAIPFPSEIDPDKVEASFRNGVLKVTLPKNAQARDRSRRIEVKPEASGPTEPAASTH